MALISNCGSKKKKMHTHMCKRKFQIYIPSLVLAVTINSYKVVYNINIDVAVPSWTQQQLPFINFTPPLTHICGRKRKKKVEEALFELAGKVLYIIKLLSYDSKKCYTL